MRKITIIAGDGIGKEVMESGMLVLESLELNFDFIKGEAGYECFQKNGNTITEETLKNAKNSQSTLFGATTSTPNQKSPIITLRKELNAFANLRPVKSFEGVNSLFKNLDFLIVRENTEGLYSQIETIKDENNENTETIATRIITKEVSERICEFAYKKTIDDNRKRITCVHKANVLKKTDGLFKESFYKIAKKYSEKHPDILANDYYVDTTAMYLITKPQEFEVIVTSNLYGDILSDEGSGLVGGLGLSPSANIGNDNALFEPVHGSAPEIAGQGIANPIAMILSITMMLDFLKENYYADKIRHSIEEVLKKGKVKTPDLGGTSKTIDMTKAILNALD